MAPVKKAPASSAAKPSKAPSAAPAALDTFKYKHTPEDAEVLASETIPSSILKDLADANWKTRLAALDEMTSWVEGAINDVDAEVVVRALAKKGWGEKNFQVSLLPILVDLAHCSVFRFQRRSMPSAVYSQNNVLPLEDLVRLSVLLIFPRNWGT